MGYTKLFSTIVTSSIWTEPDTTRLVWITMLAIADKNGEVQASVPGLARVAGVSIPATEEAIQRFLAPDQYSRTKDEDGRRIEAIDGGWLLLNHAKYRRMASKDEAKEKNAERQQRHRDRQKNNASVTQRNATVTENNGEITQERDIAEAEAEADTKESNTKTVGRIASRSPRASVKNQPEGEWVQDLQNDPAYMHIPVLVELSKMKRWCLENGRQPTRRRFVNWLNRIERPMTAGGPLPQRNAAYNPERDNAGKTTAQMLNL
jgi:hypothetical protein